MALFNRSAKGNNTTKKKKPKKVIRGRMPTKRSINLVPQDEKRVNPFSAVAGIVAILLVVSLLSKVFVVDRMMEVYRASARTVELRNSLTNTLASSREFGDVEDTYAHYTYTGMTQEELDLVDRTAVMDLVGLVLTRGETAKTWSVSGNVLTIEMTDTSLDKLNILARRMERSPIVDSVTISTARKDERRDADAKVAGRFIVYLHKPTGEEAAS